MYYTSSTTCCQHLRVGLQYSTMSYYLQLHALVYQGHTVAYTLCGVVVRRGIHTITME